MLALNGSRLNLWGGVALLTTASFVTLAGCGGGDNTASGGNSAEGSAAGGNATSQDGTAPAGADKLTGAGATFPYPLYSKWFDAYNKAKGVQINYQSIGSGAGINQLKSQTVDFGASDAPLKDSDLEKMPSEAVHIPTVAGAVVVAYNVPGAPANLKLDGPTIANIYLGKVKTWNDPAITKLNAGAKMPATNITVGHRSDGSGTTNIFTNYLKAVSPEWNTKVGAGKSVDWPTGVGGKGNDGVAGVIKQTPGGIGYVELAYAKQNKIPYASIKNAAGQFVEPNVESVTAAAQASLAALQKDIRAPIANATGAQAYPIAGFTYILAYKQQKDAAKGQALKDFLKWSMTEGQTQAAALDYSPLPQEIVALNEKTIDSIQ
jgi:phosphate transport system substrate-binding protein